MTFTHKDQLLRHTIHHNPDGSIEFTCDGCEAAVFCAIDDGFGFPVCMECRWHGERPHIAREQR